MKGTHAPTVSNGMTRMDSRRLVPRRARPRLLIVPYAIRPSTRHGFTMLELLVATAIFLTGFIAAYTMFLVGMRNRQLADAITNTAIAATSIRTEIALRAGREDGGPRPPSLYVGNGFADDGKEDGAFHRYLDQPGIWYAVTRSSSLRGEDDATTVALRLRLIVLHMPMGTDATSLPVDDAVIRRRFRIDPERTDGLDGAALLERVGDILAERQIAQAFDIVLHRHASWLP